jgi:pilus assembly protein CpaC
MTRSSSPPGQDRRGRGSNTARLAAAALVASLVAGLGFAADPPTAPGTPNLFPLVTASGQSPVATLPPGTTAPTVGTQPTPPPTSPGPVAQPGTTPAPGPYSGTLSNPLLSPTPPSLGAPQASAATQEKIAKYVSRLMDPETTLDLIAGQTRVLVLKGQPYRVAAGDENILAVSVASPKEVLLQGKGVGATVLNIWFGDPKDPAKQETLTYLVRVFPDPEAKERLEKAYKALEDDINKFFKDSSVRLKLVGDKVVITGRVRDFVQGGQILQIVRANMGGNAGGGVAAQIPLTPAGGVPAPGSNTPTYESYVAAGGQNIINLLEVAGEQQVMLRVIVAEVNRAAARSLGMNFSVTNSQGLTVFGNSTGGITPAFGGGAVQGAGGFGLGNNAFGGTVGNIFSNFNAGRIPFALNALKTVQYARSLAEPTLVTMNGQPAYFQSGGSFPVPVVTAGNAFGGLQGVQYVPYGVILNFTPFITDRDKFRIQLNATVSARDINSGTNIGGANVSGLNTRNVNTTVELRQGETLAVAGLIESNLGADATKIPFIGDLGVLGPLTGLHRTQAGEKELVIFITPELVRPIDPNQLIKLPGHEILDPNDLEFYLMGRLEGHCKDYRSPIRTDLSRIKMYYQVEGANVSGPTGYTPVGP